LANRSGNGRVERSQETAFKKQQSKNNSQKTTVKRRQSKRNQETMFIADDGKMYFSYVDIHETIKSMASNILKEYAPEIIIAIGGGGLIPARMLRTYLKIPISGVSLELYSDKTNTAKEEVTVKQWVSSDAIRGKRVLVVDEVDDSRRTLQFCVEKLQKSDPAQIAVAVVHNKTKAKTGVMPPGVLYWAGATLDDIWCCYPWDAVDIRKHEATALNGGKSRSRSASDDSFHSVLSADSSKSSSSKQAGTGTRSTVTRATVARKLLIGMLVVGSVAGAGFAYYCRQGRSTVGGYTC
jgi:uncharacterized protein